ncbi:MAG TPA: helix-turn-helix domain-containing protein [Acidimicrobiales bacterium]
MTTTDGSRRKRVRMDYDERRRLILDAATGLFLRRPYGQVSISDIADAAGVAKGLLHHYFGSKRDLYLEVVRDVTRVALPSGPALEGGQELAALGAAIDALLGFASANRDLWLNATAVGDDEVASILDDSREVLTEQIIAGLSLEDTPVVRALVRGYGGLVQEVTREWLDRGRLTEAQAREVLVRTLPLLLERVLPELRP